MNGYRTARNRLGGLIPWTAVFAGSLLTGCAGHKPPTFEVTGATLASRSAESSIILVTIEGENPNPDALPLYSIRYRASAGDGDAAGSFAAERSPERTIPRFSRGSFTVPVILANDQLSGPVGSIDLSGTVVYQVPGTIAEVFFDNDIRRPSAKVEGSASVLLDATVPISMAPAGAVTP